MAYTRPDPYSPVIVTSAGRSVDLRDVDPLRLMSTVECDEVLHALRCRASSISKRLQNARLEPLDEAKARAALQYAEASREKVLGRIRFLKQSGDQNVDMMSESAAFVAIARERLGRDVFSLIMREARGRYRLGDGAQPR
ncbi:MAG: hypothetical protein B7Y80_01760 [Hyphomicrobium sp. 32-62-53]|nr:MAG: hypothetical protein B7Z29_02110 [Hyphomicrobium sp. 12-62-95]OYY01479.1 MAG: hypothetical protein B7Y80_01760 [Hyphomicrobium sp. 32-62-53]